jgi:hypothetical protein
MSELRRGRLLAPPQALTIVLAGSPPDAGYSIRAGGGDLYRNGEHVGRALALKADADAGGIWIEYEAFPDSPLGRIVEADVA